MGLITVIGLKVRKSGLITGGGLKDKISTLITGGLLCLRDVLACCVFPFFHKLHNADLILSLYHTL